ncbi:hypothetical protein QSV08_09675 [Maribacter sp. BPC-D8]|uniref:hypothetical protein n=1 Tax=Maribacter sp. BPC-D8 TaxID=3053613 RepID=UPI002B46F31B|nr:hypothetical protein [Maribacter sp. BPC-D8]WRI31504.1 hypothetical protein QSV08_09675 [Maribacter sp. BPC-D8]
MNTKNLSELTDEELVVEKKKLKKSKIINAFVIGFLASIIAIGLVSSIYGKNYSILIPLLFPIYFIYRIVSNSNKIDELEALFKKRNI